jgi:hypothetical protein
MVAADMAADEDAQDAVRRILKERPPEEPPAGSEDRLRERLDEDQTGAAAREARKPVARSRRSTTARNKRK